MIAPDATVAGYRVERMLGRGGMGVVYEAVQASLERRVALKVLRPELAQDVAFVERFRREGRIQASLEHPHVLDVYEVGESEQGLFLAMRLIEGPTLADLLREGALDSERSLHLLDQVGAALDAAHAAGLVHRDVKPQNVLVGEGDHAFLADFGLSRAGTDTVTVSRPTLGTVAYVAPEVIRGDAPGPASDRYAFAASLFHCLTGDVVFPRGSDAAVLYAHTSEPPPRISERRAELPAALDHVFAEGLTKDPARRPGTAREVVAAAREALGDRAAALGPPDPAGEREGMAGTVPPAPARAGAEAAPGRRRLAVLAPVALCAGALGAGAVALLQPDDESAEVPVPAVAAGAQPLGSDLGRPDRSLDCRGRERAGGGPTCAVVQSELRGAQVVVPADGAIEAWAVRGARGELALEVIRPRGDDTVRVARSQWESAGNAATHRFAANLPVERGDLLGVVMGPGATIGVRETEGAATQRWLDPLGGLYGRADRGPGTGLDYELLVRAELVRGGRLRAPRQLTGAAARRAADGNVRRRVMVEISKPPAVAPVELVELGDRVAVDLLRDGRRAVRMFVPGLLPEGQPIDVKVFTYEGEDYSEVALWWVNPNSGRAIFHFFHVSRHQIEFVG